MNDVPDIPGFRLERVLGEGAYGRVYLAHETAGLARPVALKVFAQGAPAYASELAVAKRVEELRRQGRHPGIVQSLGSGEHDGRGWIALEYLERGSLRDRVERGGALPWREALDYLQQATAAVSVLHEAGLFHRDVKPANLLLGADGRLRLGDFGLSRDLDATLSAAGSPAFAAPEVIAGKIDAEHRARVDVYGLGATLAYLLTGEPARPGRPDAFALERCGTPRPLVELVLEAMAYEPPERPADGTALSLALEGVRGKLRTLSGGSEEVGEGGPDVKKALHQPAPQPRDDLGIAVERPRCPFCLTEIEAEDAKQACNQCMTWQHAGCWAEHGRCATCQAEPSQAGFSHTEFSQAELKTAALTKVSRLQAESERQQRRKWGRAAFLFLALSLPVLVVLTLFLGSRAPPEFQTQSGPPAIDLDPVELDPRTTEVVADPEAGPVEPVAPAVEPIAEPEAGPAEPVAPAVEPIAEPSGERRLTEISELTGDTREVFQRAERARNEQRYEDALRDYHWVVSVHPDLYEVYYLRGHVFLMLGDSHMAVINYDETLRLRPDYPEGYYQRANAFEREGRFHRAVEDNRKALQLLPADDFRRESIEENLRRCEDAQAEVEGR